MCGLCHCAGYDEDGLVRHVQASGVRQVSLEREKIAALCLLCVISVCCVIVRDSRLINPPLERTDTLCGSGLCAPQDTP